jgi:hypothetical protein
MVKRNSPLALVDVRFHADDDSVQIGWIQKTDIDPEHIYYQYNVTLNGKPILLNGNTIDMAGKKVLEVYIIGNEKEKTYNIPNLLMCWNPTNTLFKKVLSSICFDSMNEEDVEKNGKITIETGKNTATLNVLVSFDRIIENRILPDKTINVTWSVDSTSSDFVKIVTTEDYTEIIPTNNTDDPKEVIIYATTESGLKAAKKLP